MPLLRCLTLVLLALASRPSLAQAPSAAPAPAVPGPQIAWTEGPAAVDLGTSARIQIPEGFRFTAGDGTRTLLELMHNPTSGSELGLLVPIDPGDGDSWFVVFSFDDTGYVKDDEKSELDADAILASIREGTEQGNKLRKERGWEPIEIVGWQVQPFYNEATHNLEWATLARDNEGTSLNYSTRLLGRRGVMRVALVLGPEQLEAVRPVYQDILKGFSYTSGETYAEFRKGDKMAEYGLIALVAGGAGAVAAKTGLIAKFWKVIVAMVVAGGAGIKKLFAMISRRGEETIPGPDTQA